MRGPGTRPVPDPRLLPRLRADLAAGGYTVDGVEDLLGPVANAALRRDQPVPARMVLTGRPEPAAVLTRLFLLGDEVAAADADAALPATGAAGGAALGLLEDATQPGAVRATVDLTPYASSDAAGTAEWWLASDLSAMARGGPLPPGHVLGVGGASLTLAQLTLRRPVGRVLDLGTGCGVQALHAARHAGLPVTATDSSDRAMAFARFNAALADVRLDLRQGDLLEPVAGDRFDLVVSNPPFVITPRDLEVPGYEYRDAGLAGDDLVHRLVTDVGSVLAPGGVAQLLGNWEHRDGEAWDRRVTGWLRESGLDGWAVQREVVDPGEYAETWIRDGGEPPGPRFDAMVEAWLRDFAARGVTAVGLGYVLLRRPRHGPPTLCRVEEHRGPVREPLGEHLGTCLDLHDVLAALDDDALLATSWRRADDVTEERYHVPGQPDPAAILLRQNSGFARAVPVDALVAGCVGACDAVGAPPGSGGLPLAAIAAALADLLDVPAADARRHVAVAVRQLAADAFLLPA